MAKQDAFNEACSEAGLEGEHNRTPFLPLYEKAGNWVRGTMLNEKTITYTPKKGKGKGKKVSKLVFSIEVESSNMDGVEAGSAFTISPAGLLAYQFEKKPAGLEYPYQVGIKYLGRDAEERHQTEVRFPKTATGKREKVAA